MIVRGRTARDRCEVDLMRAYIAHACVDRAWVVVVARAQWVIHTHAAHAALFAITGVSVRAGRSVGCRLRIATEFLIADVVRAWVSVIAQKRLPRLTRTTEAGLITCADIPIGARGPSS